jgi:hypothetical protein
MRAVVVVLVITAVALVVAGFLSLCEAKQEQTRPERPVPTSEKPLPAEACKPAMVMQFWVSGKDGKLKLSGNVVLPGTCPHE